MAKLDVILKRFEAPDEVQTFEKGKFEVTHTGGMTIGRATYEPGWRWSTHVGLKVGATRCNVEHVGLVLSGRATAAMEMGQSMNCVPERSSTFRLGLPATTAGSSAMSRTSRCISWARSSTQRSSDRGPPAAQTGNESKSRGRGRRGEMVAVCSGAR